MYLGCSVIDNLLCSQVALVSNEKLVHIFAGIAIDFLQPLLDIVERLLYSKVNAVSSLQLVSLLQNSHAIRDHSVTCHLAENTFPPLPLCKAGT